tara:strand:+ start:370 stop:1377 length:1008 start_codon:yes stop_codon:yes gene_type:complete
MKLSQFVQNWTQLVVLLGCAWCHIVRGVLGTFASLLIPSAWLSETHSGVIFYIGQVVHTRAKPSRRAFTYPLRFAIVDLDAPPNWFIHSGQAADHLTAEEVRARTGNQGPVSLLTVPKVFGYVQNPICVYFSYEGEKDAETVIETGAKACKKYIKVGLKKRGVLRTCVAEVTNTPWGERVRFNFFPEGSNVPKCLHVSPFMDTLGDWEISVSDPGQHFVLRVAVKGHPEWGDYFLASLAAKRDDHAPHARSERSGITRLLLHSCTPHRIAFWIYLQAIKIAWAGIRLRPPPGLDFVRGKAIMRGQEDAVETKAPVCGLCPLHATWHEAHMWPWKT